MTCQCKQRATALRWIAHRVRAELRRLRADLARSLTVPR
jgi:hypothetical protein